MTIQARDVMISPVITIRKSATVREVARILLEKRISAVPVVDNIGKLVGMITESDLMRRAEAGTERPYWAHTHNLSVTVTNGVVDLWGDAQSSEERRAIRVAAENIAGVLAVNDHLADSPILAY